MIRRWFELAIFGAASAGCASGATVAGEKLPGQVILPAPAAGSVEASAAVPKRTPAALTAARPPVAAWLGDRPLRYVACGDRRCSSAAPLCCGPDAEHVACDTHAGCEAKQHSYRRECAGMSDCNGKYCQSSVIGNVCVDEIAFGVAGQACYVSAECVQNCLSDPGKPVSCVDGYCGC